MKVKGQHSDLGPPIMRLVKQNRRKFSKTKQKKILNSIPRYLKL